MAPGSHLRFMQITGVAQSCQSGNQAEFTRRGHVSTDQQKNVIGKNISRLAIGYIKVSNGLVGVFGASDVDVFSVTLFTTQPSRLSRAFYSCQQLPILSTSAPECKILHYSYNFSEVRKPRTPTAGGCPLPHHPPPKAGAPPLLLGWLRPCVLCHVRKLSVHGVTT